MNHSLRISLLVTLLFAVGGCMVGPKFHPPVIETPTRYQGVADSAISDLYWWQLFEDTTLHRLIVTALQQNRNVAIAYSQIEAARLTLRETRAALGPSLSYSLGAQYGTQSILGIKTDAPAQSYTIKPSLSWEIDLFGKIRRMSEANRAELLATNQAAQAILVALVAEVATTYYTLLEYEALYTVAQQTAQSWRDTYALSLQSLREGNISELDLQQITSSLASAEALTPTYQRAYAQTLHALSVLLGENPGSIIGTHTPLTELPLPAPIPSGLPSDLLARRPDMVEAYYKVMAANAQIGVAQALRFPSLSLTGEGGAYSPNFKKLFDRTALMWSTVGNLSGPIFQFGANRHKVQIAREQHRQALLNYEQSYLQALQEVEDALTAIYTYRAQLSATQTLLLSARRANDLSSQQYRIGQISLLNLLETQRTLLEAEIQYSTTLSTAMGNYATLYKALGGGITAPSQEN